MQTFLESSLAQSLLQLHLPRYAELPVLELYMDQVILVIDEAVSPLLPQMAGPVLTPTMINNYVKQKLVSPPVKKKYTRNHLAYFIIVALLKSVFSIAEISALIQRQIQVIAIDVAYDRFCTELEQAVSDIFKEGALAQKPLPANGEADLLRAAVTCIVNKIYVEKFLEYASEGTAVFRKK